MQEQRQLQRVAVVVQDGAEPFGLGAMCEVWAETYHPEDDNPVFDFVVCTPRPGRVRGASGYDLFVEHGLDAAADADLVCFSPHRDFQSSDPAVVALARETHERGALVFAHCTASFVLGEAGLLVGVPPVRGALATVEQARLAQHEGGRAVREDQRAPLVGLAGQRHDRRVGRMELAVRGEADQIGVGRASRPCSTNRS